MNSRDTALSDVVLTEEQSASINDSIGYYHNQIIYDLLEKENDAQYWANLSDHDILFKVNNAIKDVMPETEYSDTTLTQETLEFCTFVSNSAQSSNNITEMLNNIKSKYAEITDLIDILALYLQGMEIVETQEEWEQYCKDLIRIISNSGLTEEQKESLKAGINVGYASTKLWNTELLNNQDNISE